MSQMILEFKGVRYNINYVMVAPEAARASGIAFNFGMQLLDNEGEVVHTLSQLALHQGAEGWSVLSPFRLGTNGRKWNCFYMDRKAKNYNEFMDKLVDALKQTAREQRDRPRTESRPIDESFYEGLVGGDDIPV